MSCSGHSKCSSVENHFQKVIDAKAFFAQPGIAFATPAINERMEKRILGILLSILGVIGLVLGAIGFANGGSGGRSVRMTVVYLLLGAIFFFSGIALVKNTRDKAT
jgi:hypothetical protein